MVGAVDTVTWASDDGWRYHPKHVERFIDINKLYIVVSCWTITAIHGTYFSEECPVSNFAQSLATCPDIQRQIHVNFLNYASILRTLLTERRKNNVQSSDYTRSPFVTFISRRAQSGRRTSFGKGCGSSDPRITFTIFMYLFVFEMQRQSLFS